MYCGTRGQEIEHEKADVIENDRKRPVSEGKGFRVCAYFCVYVRGKEREKEREKERQSQRERETVRFKKKGKNQRKTRKRSKPDRTKRREKGAK